MNTYIFAYDLKGEDKDYAAVNAYCEQFANRSMKCLDTTWLLVTPKSIEEICRELKDVLKSEDVYVIAKIAEGKGDFFHSCIQ